MLTSVAYMPCVAYLYVFVVIKVSWPALVSGRPRGTSHLMASRIVYAKPHMFPQLWFGG
jgi:hypothetical protein